MSIHDKLAAVAEELHLSGYGSELTEGVKRVAGVLADELHALAGGDVVTRLEQLATDKLLPALEASLSAAVEKAKEDILAGVDERVKTLFAELLAKAAADDAAKAAAPPAPTPPAEPQPQA